MLFLWKKRKEEEEEVSVFCDSIANVFYDSKRRKSFSTEEEVVVSVFLMWTVSCPYCLTLLFLFFFLNK
tara:strand:+ start:303 stop:509 length:207 start_codon:yes stop_codon:yes gene_type:complete